MLKIYLPLKGLHKYLKENLHIFIYMIIIPLCGNNQSFENKYNTHKVFLQFKNDVLINFCLKSLEINDKEKVYFIVNNRINNRYNIKSSFETIFKFSFEIILLNNDTQNILETLRESIKLINIDKNEKIIIFTPYIYFDKPFNTIEFNTNDLFLITFKSNSEKHSYVLTDNSYIINVAEKNIISSDAIAGLYGFRNFDIFNKLISQSNGMIYISQLFNIAKEQNLTLQTREAGIVYCFDTINDYEFYRNRLFNKNLKVGLCCDHSGLLVKNKLKMILDEMKIEYIDYGTYSNKACDYYEFIFKLKNDYIHNIIDIGIGSCRSGQGVNICANHLGFLSTLIYNNTCVKLTREHNCSNFFVIPECLLENIDLKQFINDIYSANFQGGRHYDRLNQVLSYK